MAKTYENECLGLGVGGYDYDTTYKSVLHSLKLGYRVIDTAENYHNEDAVGNAIIDSGIERNKIIIVSKYFGGINYGETDDVLNSFDFSLKKLKTDYIDIYLIHTPFGCKWVNEWEPVNNNKFINYKNRISVWLQFIELKKQHLVKYIGVSNWTLDNINELKFNGLYMPDIIQIEWCPSFYDKKIYDYCVENSIRIMGYGLFSRNSINEIQNIGLNVKNRNLSDILIKWSLQKKIIVIVRSCNNNNLLANLNTSQEPWELSDEDMTLIDNTLQKSKGHCLKNVYDKNYNVNFWKPLILSNNLSEAKVDDLIDGNISCIIAKGILTENMCSDVLKKMEEKNLLKNQLPYDNYGIRFRGHEIGITMDNIAWRDSPENYFNECVKVNKLFENIFDETLNPFEIMFKSIKKIIGHKYVLKRLHYNGIECPIGVFRVLADSMEFPYHTDGFNYGKILNSKTNYVNLFKELMDQDCNSVVAIILVLQQGNKKNEIDLYNQLVSDLEFYEDELGMYSHWMGTKYTNINELEVKLQDKQFFSPILNTGDMYIFSSSRIHKLNNFLEGINRIVLATFGYFKNGELILYQ